MIEVTFTMENDGSTLAKNKKMKTRFHQRKMMTKFIMIYQAESQKIGLQPGTYGGVDQQSKTREKGRFTTKHGRFSQQIHYALFKHNKEFSPNQKS